MSGVAWGSPAWTIRRKILSKLQLVFMTGMKDMISIIQSLVSRGTCPFLHAGTWKHVDHSHRVCVGNALKCGTQALSEVEGVE